MGMHLIKTFGPKVAALAWIWSYLSGNCQCLHMSLSSSAVYIGVIVQSGFFLAFSVVVEVNVQTVLIKPLIMPCFHNHRDSIQAITHLLL